MAAVLFLVVAGEHRRERVARSWPSGDVGDEAEPALVDADQRHAVARELAARCRASCRRRRPRPRGRSAAPSSSSVERRVVGRCRCCSAVSRSSDTSQALADQELRDRPRAPSRMPSAWYLPTSAACRKRVDMRGITPQRPLSTQAKIALQRLQWNHAGRACQDAAEDPGRTLHRRRPAGRLAHAVARQRARAVAGDDPQRDGRPRGARPDRQPAHQRRAASRPRAAIACSSTPC